MLPKSIRKLLTLIVAVIVGLILLRLLEQPPRVGRGVIPLTAPPPSASGATVVS